MRSLHEVQTKLTASILSGCGAIEDVVSADGITAERRLRIYRNNRRCSLIEALLAAYPVVARLVGTEFFEYAATGYLQDTPLRCANLQYYGQRFADFLQAMPALTGLPYVSGVARLEWACQEVCLAPTVAPLDLARLRRVPQAAYGDMCLMLSAAVRLLRSNYPLLRIWQVNQPGYAGESTVNLAEGGEQLLIMRSATGPQFLVLTEVEYLFLRALSKGRALQIAADLALARQADFNLAATLVKHVRLGTLVGFSLPRSQA